MGNLSTDACCDAMEAETKPGDVVVVARSLGAGMTVRYLSPRAGQKNPPDGWLIERARGVWDNDSWEVRRPDDRRVWRLQYEHRPAIAGQYRDQCCSWAGFHAAYLIPAIVQIQAQATGTFEILNRSTTVGLLPRRPPGHAKAFERIVAHSAGA